MPRRFFYRTAPLSEQLDNAECNCPFRASVEAFPEASGVIADFLEYFGTDNKYLIENTYSQELAGAILRGRKLLKSINISPDDQKRLGLVGDDQF